MIRTVAIRAARVVLAAALASGALVSLAGAAQAAACATPAGTTRQVCVESFSYSPATVVSGSANSFTFTVTARLTNSTDRCIQVRWPVPNDPTASIYQTLGPVQGQPGVFRADILVVGTSRPGTYAPRSVESCDAPSWSLNQAQLTAGGVTQGFTFTGTSDAQAPQLRSLTTSTTSVDVTRGDVLVTARARITDAGVGTMWAALRGTYTKNAAANGELPFPAVETGFDRVSGTESDGVYEAVLRVPAGSWGTWALSVDLTDRYQNVNLLSTSQLSAAGYPSAVAARTTAAPTAPTNLKGSSTWVVDPYAGARWEGKVTYASAVNGPYFRGVAIGNSACGSITGAGTSQVKQVTLVKRQVPLPCTIKLRLVNAAGSSATVAHTFV